jgi:hypothetical protein
MGRLARPGGARRRLPFLRPFASYSHGGLAGLAGLPASRAKFASSSSASVKRRVRFVGRWCPPSSHLARNACVHVCALRFLPQPPPTTNWSCPLVRARLGGGGGVRFACLQVATCKSWPNAAPQDIQSWQISSRSSRSFSSCPTLTQSSSSSSSCQTTAISSHERGY